MKFLYAISMIALLLTGCGSSTSKDGKTLRIAFNKEPPTIDVRKSGDSISSALQFMLYTGLTHVNEENEVEFDLAENVKVSANGKEYLFTIKEAYWSDGSRIVAQDFEKSWKTILSKDFPAPNAQLFSPIKNARAVKEGSLSIDEVGITSLDESTLKVSLEHPTPFFLRLISFVTFFPIKEDSKGGFLYCGPFTLEKWIHHDQLVLRANPNYYAPEKIEIDTLKIAIVESEGTALKMYEQGELDFIGGCICQLPLDLVGHYIYEGKANFMPMPATTRLYFNSNIPPFHNKKIRKAISLSLDREEIIKAVAPLPAEVATGLVPPMIKRKGAPAPKMFGNPRQLLKEGLAEEGLTELPEVSMLYAFSEMNDKIVQVVQEQLRKNLGMTLHLEGLDFKHYLSRLKNRDYQMAQGKWIAQYNDPINILEPFKFRKDLMNIPNWESTSYVNYLDGSTLTTSADERLRILEKAEQVLSDELPICPLFHWSDTYLLSPKVKKFYISATRPLECQLSGES